jgi:DNA-binding CsgD family transcriptional regulator
MDSVADSADGLGRTPAGLQQCLGSMLAAFERSVGFAEGVVMSFDPGVLLPNGFAATVVRGLDDSLVACRNEQLDRDFLKFRDLAGLAMRAGHGAALDARGEAGGEAAEAGSAVAVRVRTGDGWWVRARAEPITSASGSARGVTIVIEEARAGWVLPLAASAYRLTGRELEVVRCVLNGLDTRSAAAALHISEYTVQDHLKSVFDKVGVRSRRELAHELAVHLG